MCCCSAGSPPGGPATFADSRELRDDSNSPRPTAASDGSARLAASAAFSLAVAWHLPTVTAWFSRRFSETRSFARHLGLIASYSTAKIANITTLYCAFE